jgi:hypothetical protein
MGSPFDAEAHHLPTAVGPNPPYGDRGSPGIAAKRSYLNRTCWNELSNVNGEQRFNTPLGENTTEPPSLRK